MPRVVSVPRRARSMPSGASAHAGAGRHVDDVAEVGVAGAAAVEHAAHVGRRRDHAFGQEQAQREFVIGAGRSHRDGERLASDADLERLLDRHGVERARVAAIGA